MYLLILHSTLSYKDKIQVHILIKKTATFYTTSADPQGAQASGGLIFKLQLRFFSFL